MEFRVFLVALVVKKLEDSEAKIHSLALITSFLGNLVTSVIDGPTWGPSTHPHLTTQYDPGFVSSLKPPLSFIVSLH